jgi:hypothetical protein
MKKVLLYTAVLFFAALFSCQKETEVLSPQESDFDNEKSVVDYCGEELKNTLRNAAGERVGAVILYNDATDLYVQLTVADPNRLIKSQLYVGDCRAIPLMQNGDADPAAFPYQASHKKTRKYIYKIALANLPAGCICVSVRAEYIPSTATAGSVTPMTAWGAGTKFIKNGVGRRFEYCIQSCETPCEVGHRTQTQGGWGTGANGNNPGAYRDANFAAAFPGGLVVGDACGFQLTFTSSSAVESFLPQGGPSSALSADATDPGNIHNNFAGQVTALSLSVGFDAYDADFSVSPTPLVDLVVLDANSPLYGVSVGAILDYANKVLAGCAAPYTLEQLHDAVDTINNNFVDGTANEGFLGCPQQ